MADSGFPAKHNNPLGQKMVKGKAGTVYFYIPHEHGRPSSPTISIKRPSGLDLPTAVSDVAMDTDQVSTSLAANPAKGDVELTLSSVANVFIGRSYIIQTNKQRERAVVLSIDSGNTKVTVADELRIDHASGSTFKGYLISHALSAPQNATAERNLHARVKWVDEDGVTHYSSFVYHVVHSPWLMPTNEEDVLRSWPDAHIQTLLRRKQLGLRDAIDQSSDELVLSYLRPRGYSEDQFFDAAAFTPMHVGLVRRNLVLAAYQHDEAKMTALADYWTDWLDKTWERLLESLPPYDDDNDGILDSGESSVQEGAGVFLSRSVSTSNPDGIDSDDFHPQISKVGIGSGRTEW